MSTSFRKLKHNKDDFISADIFRMISESNPFDDDFGIYIKFIGNKKLKNIKTGKILSYDMYIPDTKVLYLYDSRRFFVERIDGIEELL